MVAVMTKTRRPIICGAIRGGDSSESGKRAPEPRRFLDCGRGRSQAPGASSLSLRFLSLLRTAARPLTCSAFSLKMEETPMPSIIFSVVSTMPVGMYLRGAEDRGVGLGVRRRVHCTAVGADSWVGSRCAAALRPVEVSQAARSVFEGFR